MEEQKKLMIAIVADNPLFAEMLKKSVIAGLEQDVEVETIHSPSFFFKEVENGNIQPDVIVLDYVLNRTEGEDRGCKNVLGKIKRLVPEAAIVMISDEEDMAEAVQSLQYGANEYVSKDKFAFSHITNAVKNCLNPSRS